MSADRLRALVGEGEHDQRAGHRRLRGSRPGARPPAPAGPAHGGRHARPRPASAGAGYVALARRPRRAGRGGRVRRRPPPSAGPATGAAGPTGAGQGRSPPSSRRWPAVLEELADDGFDAVHAPGPVRVVDPATGGRAAPPPAANRRTPCPSTSGCRSPRFPGPGGPAEHRPPPGRRSPGRAEEAGFTSLWVMDHFIQIPQVGRHWDEMLDSWTDPRLPRRPHHPGDASARWSPASRTATSPTWPRSWPPSTCCRGGRAVCGLGAAWFDREHRAYGFDFPPVRQRFRAAGGRPPPPAR